MSYDLGKPVHHCSYILNEGLGISFRDCINQYRVQYFIEQYPQRRYFLTLEAISKESGFKNESTFYKVFKKEKGVTPGRYFN
jgi:AraC-like DNA-binding protein